MHKRMTLRIVPDLAERLTQIAKNRGLSINSLISEMAWDFVENWNAVNENEKRRMNDQK